MKGMRLAEVNAMMANRSHQGTCHNPGIGVEKGQAKVGKVMREYKKGKLHMGKTKKIVKNRKQAIAIGLSEAGLSKR